MQALLDRPLLRSSGRSQAQLGVARLVSQRSLWMTSVIAASAHVPLAQQRWLGDADPVRNQDPKSVGSTSVSPFTLATWNVLADGLAQTGGWLHVRTPLSDTQDCTFRIC